MKWRACPLNTLRNQPLVLFYKKSSARFFLRKLYHKMMSKIITSHEQRILNFYSKFINPGDLCFDVGANIGNITKIFLKLGARVVAVEPQEECTAILRNNYGKNKKIDILEIALGDQDGFTEMLMGDLHVLSTLSKEWLGKVKNSGRFKEHQWTEKRTVQITTIDSLINAYGMPNFIKIDVEGYEYHVLKGLTKPVKLISFEFTAEFIDYISEILCHLESLGTLKVNLSLGESFSLYFNEWEGIPQLMNTLENISNKLLWGDIYVRFD